MQKKERKKERKEGRIGREKYTEHPCVSTMVLNPIYGVEQVCNSDIVGPWTPKV
jgi:hypothetical protein